MFIETIRTDGLAHLSYLVGDGGEAAVIDPRRDGEVYRELARHHDCRITHIFETHRNEDLVSGAAALGAATGAPVHHGVRAGEPVAYAEETREGDCYRFDEMTLGILETPGHTDDSLSLVLTHEQSSDEPLAVFTGDCLFVGDVGRTDLFPGSRTEGARAMYRSITGKLLELGDHVLVYPAHGAGSVCGSGMADRDVTTLGYERRHNPSLPHGGGEEAFVARQLEVDHPVAPYFSRMEAVNMTGAPATSKLPTPPLFSIPDFERALEQGAVAVDTRSVSSFLGAHVPRSYCLPGDMLEAFGGWLLPADQPLVLICDSAEDIPELRRRLARIGYDDVLGVLSDGLVSWSAAGRSIARLPAVDAARVHARLQEKQSDWLLLDVRRPDEFARGHLPGAHDLHVGDLPARLEELPRRATVTVMCNSGARAALAAGLLQRNGWDGLEVFLGSMAAWKHAGGMIESSPEGEVREAPPPSPRASGRTRQDEKGARR